MASGAACKSMKELAVIDVMKLAVKFLVGASNNQVDLL